MKKIINRRGEGYVDVAVAVLVISFLIILIVSVFGAVSQKQNLKYMCSELVEVAVVNGVKNKTFQRRRFIPLGRRNVTDDRCHNILNI